MCMVHPCFLFQLRRDHMYYHMTQMRIEWRGFFGLASVGRDSPPTKAHNQELTTEGLSRKARGVWRAQPYGHVHETRGQRASTRLGPHGPYDLVLRQGKGANSLMVRQNFSSFRNGCVPCFLNGNAHIAGFKGL
jgi:hypothetical protein